MSVRAAPLTLSASPRPGSKAVRAIARIGRAKPILATAPARFEPGRYIHATENRIDLNW